METVGLLSGWASIILTLAFIVLLIIFFTGVFIKKYRINPQNSIIAAALIFAGLLLSYCLIYWSFLWLSENPPQDYMILDLHPFPEMFEFTVNFLVPCMVFVILATLILTRKEKKQKRFWFGLAIAILSTCGFLVLVWKAFSDFGDENNLHTLIWWL